MYCVKCGVRLQEGTERCPLCATPVWNPKGIQPETGFPDRYPEASNTRLRWAVLLTLLPAILAAALVIVWLNVGGGAWGGISLLGIAVAYVAFVMPLWFKRVYVYIWIPIVSAAIAGYTLFICHVLGGHWFLSFAFPIICIHGVFATVVSVLLQYIRGGRCYILGGSIIAYGGCTMLIELFEHITFKQPMFVWSIYSAAVLFLAGMFLIVVGIIKPFKRFLQRYLFF